MYNIEKIKKDLKEILSEKRYSHSLRVSEIALDLAKKYNEDTNKAYIAGLVHDIAKEFTEEQNIYYITKYNLSKRYLKKECKNVLHGPVGAAYLKEKYDMEDEICNAVKVHTTASSNMTMLDKIIFVADKIEPNKNHLGVEEERKLAYTNIDKCIILCLENNIKNLKERDKIFDETIIKTLSILKK